jgi:hypothetical protein
MERILHGSAREGQMKALPGREPQQGRGIVRSTEGPLEENGRRRKEWVPQMSDLPRARAGLRFAWGTVFLEDCDEVFTRSSTTGAAVLSVR